MNSLKRSIKRHFALIVPLFALLFSFECLLLLERMISDYESKLNQDYVIVLSSPKELQIQSIQRDIKEASSLEKIDPKTIIDRLKNDLSAANLALLQKSLPYFYSLQLSRFPSQDRLNEIGEILKKNEEITRVETFAKIHSQSYQLLLLFNSSMLVVGILIGLLSLLLMVKQIEIWKFEHTQRMEIMAFFGAPLWMRSGVLFRLAFIDSLIATALVLGAFVYALNNPRVIEVTQSLGLNLGVFSLVGDSILLLFLGLFLSLGCVWIVIMKQKG